MVGIREMLFGSKDNWQSTLNKGQQGVQGQILQNLKQMMGQGGGYGQAEDYFKNILGGNLSDFEAPYLQNFNQNIIPGIAERFAGKNAMGGGLSSSGFGQALGGAGAQLQAQLAGLRGQQQGNAANSIFGQYNQLANQGLQQSQAYQPGSTGVFGGYLQTILENLGPMKREDILKLLSLSGGGGAGGLG